jgi:hypothetical protein
VDDEAEIEPVRLLPAGHARSGRAVAVLRAVDQRLRRERQPGQGQIADRGGGGELQRLLRLPAHLLRHLHAGDALRDLHLGHDLHLLVY